MPRVRTRMSIAVAAFALTLGGLVGLSVSAADALDAPSGLLVDASTAGQTAGIPVLSWDRVDTATSYDVQVSTDLAFATSLWSVTGTANSQAVPTVQIPAGETLYWRVRAKSSSTTGGWSDAMSFERTQSSGPTNPHTEAASFTAPDPAVLSWDPVPGAVSYTVDVGTDDLFTDSTLYKSYTTKATSYVVPLQAPATYFWRVTAALGGSSSAPVTTPPSSTASYVVNPLPDPVLTSPADGGTIDGDIALDWQPVPGAATYNLQISTDSQFKTTVTNVTGIRSTQYSPPQTLNNGTYYWRVHGVDASGYAAPWPDPTTSGAVRSFTRVWSAQPQLKYPTDGASFTDQSTPLFFEWSGTQLASSYQFQIGTAPNNFTHTCTTTLTTFTPQGDWSTGSDPINSQCMPRPSTQPYYWRVVGVDDPAKVVTQAINAQVGSFIYDPPARVADSSTLDLLSGYDVALDGTDFGGDDTTHCAQQTCTNLRQTPVLRWTPRATATSYRVYIAQDAAFTNILAGYPKLVTEPIFAPTATLPDAQAGGTAYYWEVEPCEGTGSSQVCSGLVNADHTFNKLSGSVQANDPSCPTVNGDLTCSDDVTLSWQDYLASESDPNASGTTGPTTYTTPARTEAESYVVQWATDPSFTTNLKSETVDQTTFTLADATFPEGPVYWRVSAIDGSGNPLAPSTTHEFVKRSPSPTLLDPGTIASNAAVIGSLGWQPLNFAKTYDLEVYPAGSGAPGTTAAKLTASGITTDSYALTTPLPAGTYDWHVRRGDADGRKGAWSDWGEFTVTANVPVDLQGPSDGSAVPPSDALFRWSAAPSAASYTVERWAPGSSTITDSVIRTPALAWAPTTAIVGGTWDWHVIAYDSSGNAIGTSATQSIHVIDTPVATQKAAITGTPQVDATLQAVAPAWSFGDEPTPPAVTNSYQWLRNGSAIANATGSTYVVVPADAGNTLQVRVTGSAPGYKTATSVSSALTATAGPALIATSPPTISGTAKISSVLTATAGEWPHSPHFSYQWLRNGQAIPYATQSSYRVATADSGTRLSVRVTATATGYAPGNSTSKSITTARIASKTTLKLAASRIRRTVKPTLTISLSIPGMLQPTGKFQIKDGTTVLTTTRMYAATYGNMTRKLPLLSVGSHILQVHYLGTSAIAPSSSARVTLTVTR